jgi:hypothetical protein
MNNNDSTISEIKPFHEDKDSDDDLKRRDSLLSDGEIFSEDLYKRALADA